MADSKVTDLTAATSVNSADVVYLVQSSTDKKLSISTLLANLPNTLTKFSGTIAVGGSTQTIVNDGIINSTNTITFISNTESCTATILDGSIDGQLKLVIMTSAIGTTTIDSNIADSSITFSTSGESVLLYWSQSGSKWYTLSRSASTYTTNTVPLNVPQNSQPYSGTYVLQASDAGKHIYKAAGIVSIPTSAVVDFPLGTLIQLVSFTDTLYVNAVETVTTVIYGATLGAHSSWGIPARSTATLIKIEAEVWMIYGPGLFID